jgi:hypothetical protein
MAKVFAATPNVRPKTDIFSFAGSVSQSVSQSKVQSSSSADQLTLCVGWLLARRAEQAT